MAWEWSHTAEGIDAVHTNLEKLDTEALREIYSEWKAWDGNTSSTEGFDEDEYRKALESCRDFAHDTLVEFIWEKAQELRTCNNGGHLAWVCPFGCCPHCLPFEVETEDD